MTDVRDKNLGQVFTNTYIVDLILDEIGYNGKHVLGKYILEPSTGNGAFLQEIVRRIIRYSPPEDLAYNLSFVYGWELDTDVYKECIENLNKIIESYNITVDWNIENVNSIFKTKLITGIVKDKNTVKFDYVVGNPPYLLKKNLDKETEKFISSNYFSCKGNYDLYYAFFELGWRFMKKDGICAYITPNTYFYNVSGKSLRKFFVGRLKKIIDYKENIVFKNVSTYTCITIFSKDKKYKEIDYQYNYIHENIKEYKNKNVSNSILVEGINSGWNLDNDSKNEETGTTIRSLTKIYRGVSTKNDKVFILTVNSMNGEYVNVTNRNDETFDIEKKILRRIVKISKKDYVTDQKKEYTIFPYEYANSEYFVMNEDILKTKYPKAYSYLSGYKNDLESRGYKKWYSLDDGYVSAMKAVRGDIIVFSQMMDVPKFYQKNNNDDTLYYSGYIMKGSKANIDKIHQHLSKDEIWEKIYPRFNKIRGGWYRVKVSIIQDLVLS